MKERKSKVQTKSKVQSVVARGGGAKDPREGKVESEGMIVHRVSRDGKTLKKRNGRKESDEGKEGRGRRRDAFGKADTRRDAPRKFYCRSLRGFHLQISRVSPFLGCELSCCGRDGEKRREKNETSRTSREKYTRKHTRARRKVSRKREMSNVFFESQI